MSKRLDTSNTNKNGVSKEDAKLPFMLPPLTSADLTTVSYYRCDEDNRIDGEEDRKLPATQTSLKIHKPYKTNVIEAEAEEQQAKNAPATTNSKTASIKTKHIEDKEGSKFTPKADPVVPTLKDSAFVPPQKQARASSQFYIEKLAVDARSRNRKERKRFRRTNKHNSAVSNHQRIVNYVRKKKLPMSQNIDANSKKEREIPRRTNKNNSAVSNHQRIVNYARTKRSRGKRLPTPQNTAETNSDDMDISQGDEGRDEIERVSRPGAFAVSGIGGESGNNAWRSTYDLQIRSHFAMSKRLDTSNTNKNGVSKEDAKLPFMLPPLTSADLTTVSYYRCDEDNRIDGEEDRKLPATQTSLKIHKPYKTNVIEAEAEEQQAKNAPATTNSKTASIKTKHIEDKEGSKFTPKADPVVPTLKDSAFVPPQKQARASSQFYIEKLAVDARSRNRKERKRFRRTNKHNSAVSNHQRIVNYVRKKKLPMSQNIDANSKKEREIPRRTNKNNSAVSNHQRIVNYARTKRSRGKRLPTPQNTAETNSDDMDISQGDEGRDEIERVSRPGAFAVSGIGGESGNNAWRSTYDLQPEEDDSEAEEESEYFATVVDNETFEDESEYFATVVDDETLHEKIRENILANEVTIASDIVPTDEYLKKEKCQCLLWAFGVLSVLGTVIGLSIGLTRTNESESTVSAFPSATPTLAPTSTKIPTLDTIQNNGKVRCGIGYFIDFETDLCRALAAAVLDDPEKIDLVTHTLTSRWEALDNESLDVLILPSDNTMSRDVYQKDAKTGFTFSAPYLYDGLAFGGIPEYVDCADRLDTYFGNCSETRICVNMGGSSHGLLADNVADFNLRPVAFGDFYEMIIKGKCNVLAGPSTAIAEFILRIQGYTGDYKVGKSLLLKQPTSMVTREDDKKWSDFVNWVFRSLLAAEEQNITNTTASKFITTTVFGDKYKDMFVNAIQAVGNFGDLYRRNMEHIIPRDSLKFNLLNNGSTGLHFAYPLGEFTEGPDPIAGSTIHSITKKEGKLRCGIFDREGFGKEIVSTTGTRWQGMDADYCYALSASLFGGDTKKVVFVNLTNSVDGFQTLGSGLVDVVAGVPWTLEGDVNETSTGKGYTFSIPYFYGDENGSLVQENASKTTEGALSLVTREDDSQWSDFVFWIVSATFIAEEEYITQKMSKDMVGISVFGPSFVNMHLHAIGAVGNYGEIYSRNVESIIPRQGRNLLNSNPFGPQQFSFF